VSFGINAFTVAISGKNLLSSSKELKKVVGDSVGSKWGKKAKKEPLLECNLQFFADKNGCEPTGATYEGSIYRSVDSRYNPLEMSQYTINSNHRYTESGVPGLYFSSGEKIVKAELGNYDVFDFSNRTMYQYDVRLTNMLDVSNPSVRSQLNISLESIIGESYDVTHAIGRYAYSNGYNEIIAPSARADGGINIILFNAKGVK
jgi:RES domain-containing protein